MVRDLPGQGGPLSVSGIRYAIQKAARRVARAEAAWEGRARILLLGPLVITLEKKWGLAN